MKKVTAMVVAAIVCFGLAVLYSMIVMHTSTGVHFNSMMWSPIDDGNKR